jgi:hypothetical protein
MQKRKFWFGVLPSASTEAITVWFLCLLLGVTQSARADVASCINSHASGQREAKAGRLKVASELFASCGSGEDCPSEIRAECVELYHVVEMSIPTVLFTAIDKYGKDFTAVRVYSNNQLLTEHLDGHSIALDPGKYVFRFVSSRGEVVSGDVLVREGEKNRVVSVQMQEQPASTLQQQEAAPVAPSPRNDSAKQGSLPVGFWLSAGVGTAALASFGVFGLLGHSHQSTIAKCSPNCDASRHDDFDSMKRDYLIADISLGVAVASAGAATWFFFTNGHSSSPTKERTASRHSAPLSIQPILWGRGAGLVVSADAF